MISGCGRYEFVQGTSAKQWTIYFDKASGKYITEWGKIGQQAQGRKDGLSEVEAQKKIREKLNKGYRHVGGFTSEATVVDFQDDEEVTETITISHTITKGRRKLDL
jgi:predicted DNA-binding WGR domain protein